MVPVPRRHLGPVYAALAESMAPAAEASEAATGDDEAVDVVGQGEWTAPMVARLESELTYEATRALLTLAAQRAPRPITFSEAVESAGTTEIQLRAELAALTKITKRVFGKKTWPISYRYGDGGVAIYSMDPVIGEWWINATEGSGDAAG
jgi:hypothetical protein